MVSCSKQFIALESYVSTGLKAQCVFIFIISLSFRNESECEVVNGWSSIVKIYTFKI